MLHLNSAASGGGVAELLNSVAPLQAGAGLKVEWKVLARNDRFFGVTKKIHNALQGLEAELSPEEKAIYLSQSEEYAASFEGDYDVVFMHDPQPAAIPRFLKNHRDTRMDLALPHRHITARPSGMGFPGALRG